jgi:hypothetical protein
VIVAERVRAAKVRRNRRFGVATAGVILGTMDSPHARPPRLRVSVAARLSAWVEWLGVFVDRCIGDAPDSTGGSDFHSFDALPDRRLDGDEWVARIVLPPH